MKCVDCGYVLSDLDKDCPRCRFTKTQHTDAQGKPMKLSDKELIRPLVPTVLDTKVVKGGILDDRGWKYWVFLMVAFIVVCVIGVFFNPF